MAIAHEVLETTIRADSNGAIVIASFSKNALVTFDGENGALNVQGCHLTQYGICKHNYVSSGCKKFAECLDCEELVCIKGVSAFEANAKEKAELLRNRLLEYRQYLAYDIAAGVEDADQWLKKTERQLAKLEALISGVYENEAVPKGTAIRLSSNLEHTSALAESLIERLGIAMDKRDSTRGVFGLALRRPG